MSELILLLHCEKIQAYYYYHHTNKYKTSDDFNNTY